MTTMLTLLALCASANPLDKPIVRIVPVSEIAADGATDVQMVVVAYNVDGSPITGMELRTQAAKGKAGDWVEAGGGVYTFAFTPPKLEAATTTSVTVRGRTPSKDTINISDEETDDKKEKTEDTITADADDTRKRTREVGRRREKLKTPLPHTRR